MDSHHHDSELPTIVANHFTLGNKISNLISGMNILRFIVVCLFLCFYAVDIKTVLMLVSYCVVMNLFDKNFS